MRVFRALRRNVPLKFDIFLLSFLVFSMCISTGPFQSSNERSHYAITLALIEYGTLDITHHRPFFFHSFYFPDDLCYYTFYDLFKYPMYLPYYAWEDVSLYQGKYYSAEAPGIAFLAVPLHIVGRTFSNPFDKTTLTPAITTLLSAFFAALSVAIVYEISRLLGVGKKACTVASIAYAFGTPLWLYAATFFAHAASAFFITLGYYFAMKFIISANKNRRWLSASGLSLGYAGFVEYPNAILLAPVFLYLLDSMPTIRETKKLLWFVAPACAGLLPIFLYNSLCFGSPLAFPANYFMGFRDSFSLYEQFDNPLFIGLDGLLFSSSRGLFFHSPALLLSILGFAPLFWRRRREAILLISSFLLLLILYARFTVWHGGYAYGPRYLLAISFTLVVFLAAAVDHSRKSRVFVLIFLPLLGMSVLLSASAALTKNWDYPLFANALPMFLRGEFDCWPTSSINLLYLVSVGYLVYVIFRVRNHLVKSARSFRAKLNEKQFKIFP